MNESALTNRTAEQAAALREELPLFEPNADSTMHAADGGRPKLTLVRAEEFDGEECELGAPLTDVSNDTTISSDGAVDSWPWVKEDTVDIIRESAVDRFEGPDPVESSPAANASVNESVVDDLSAVEDVVLSNPQPDVLELEASTPELEVVPNPPAMSTRSALATAPRAIGSGRLVPARLTWKPGDPFAGVASNSQRHFRWELMLTAACITSVCGLGCIWLLRTLLA